MSATCPYCRGELPAIGLAALAKALRRDDLDAAIDLGLLSFEPGDSHACPSCSRMLDEVIAARDARRGALAARERHRIRNARLALQAEARAARRTIAAVAGGGSAGAALPSAAAAALARAKARVAGSS